MNRKKAIIIGILSATVIVSAILMLMGKPAFSAIIIGAFTSFIIYGVYAPPDKHKSFGYKDQQRAMRAFDRTDSLEFEIATKPKKRKKKSS